MTDEQQDQTPVTPEWLRQVASETLHDEGPRGGPICNERCPACALNKAAEVLREAQAGRELYMMRIRALERAVEQEWAELNRLEEDKRRLREALEAVWSNLLTQMPKDAPMREIAEAALSTNSNEEPKT